MNVLLHLVVAVVLIAVFILIRILTEKALIRQRLQGGEGCSDSGCHGGCHGQDDANSRTGGEKTIEPMNRSAHHAPR